MFSLAFYLATSNLSGSRAALWTVLLSPAVILLVQVLFVWKFIQAILRIPKTKLILMRSACGNECRHDGPDWHPVLIPVSLSLPLRISHGWEL